MDNGSPIPDYVDKVYTLALTTYTKTFSPLLLKPSNPHPNSKRYQTSLGAFVMAAPAVLVRGIFEADDTTADLHFDLSQPTAPLSLGPSGTGVALYNARGTCLWEMGTYSTPLPTDAVLLQALIAGLILALSLHISHIKIHGPSLSLLRLVTGTRKINKPSLLKACTEARDLLAKFKGVAYRILPNTHKHNLHALALAEECLLSGTAFSRPCSDGNDPPLLPSPQRWLPTSSPLLSPTRSRRRKRAEDRPPSPGRDRDLPSPLTPRTPLMVRLNPAHPHSPTYVCRELLWSPPNSSVVSPLFSRPIKMRTTSSPTPSHPLLPTLPPSPPSYDYMYQSPQDHTNILPSPPSMRTYLDFG